MGKLAPALSIQALDGKTVAPAQGKVTVVEFWATWYAPSGKALSQLEEIKSRSGGNVEVIGVALNDTTSGVADFAKARNVSFPIAWDEHQTMKRRWGVTTPGTMYILDPKGTVRFVHEADKNKDESEVIAREVASLLTESSLDVAPPATTPATAVASATVPTAVPVAAPAAAPAPAQVEETPAPPPPSEPVKPAKGRGKAPAKKAGGAKPRK